MSNFGQILREIGEFGLFQGLHSGKRLLFALCALNVFPALDVIGQVFTGQSFPHHCNTDWILERGPNLTEERQKNLTIPVNEDGSFESCEMFTPVDWDLEDIEKYGINTTTKCMDGWDYEAGPGGSTLVTEFDVVCDKNGLIAVSQSISMAGILIGALVYGIISDRFGRRFAILLAISFLLVFGVATAFSPNIYVYMVFKFFCGTSSVSMTMNVSVLGELIITDPSKAALCTMVILCFSGIGQMSLSGIAYLIHNWRILQLVLFSPLVILLGAHYWILPESARWLLAHGKKKKAQKELQRAARINGTKLPEDLLDQINMERTSERRNVFDIFKIPYLRKYTLIMGFIWFAVSLLYYGLALNVGSFGMNIYLTQFIFALVEIPANVCGLFLIQHFGRRLCEACFLIFGGTACLVVLAVPKGILQTLNMFLLFKKCHQHIHFLTDMSIFFLC
uniref:Solute carrier family 22 member 13b n=1 Tax=Amphiprion percula TaxID=161767 RepID=A0A3P8TIR2_AMPPE